MSAISIVTLAKGRAEHLYNLVLGLTRQTTPPRELIVAVMQDEPYVLPETDFPVRQLMIAGEALPLAAARNLAARTATGEGLI